MKLTHISLTAKDAIALAAFYKSVFGFMDRRPPRRLSGEMVYRGNGLPGVDILVIWLALPGSTTPFLEIMQYDQQPERPWPAVNAPGFGHLAFEVPDLEEVVDRVMKSGGTLQGQVTDFGTKGAPNLLLYVRDPEGNILELENRADHTPDSPAGCT